MERFNKRLKELRTEKKLTQKELSVLLKTNNSSVCDWECGRSETSIDTIIELCKIFEVSSDYLLGIED